MPSPCHRFFLQINIFDELQRNKAVFSIHTEEWFGEMDFFSTAVCFLILILTLTYAIGLDPWRPRKASNYYNTVVQWSSIFPLNFTSHIFTVYYITAKAVLARSPTHQARCFWNFLLAKYLHILWLNYGWCKLCYHLLQKFQLPAKHADYKLWVCYWQARQQTHQSHHQVCQGEGNFLLELRSPM